ncbi:MAG TPA: type I-C CRISPR-associated protein Cas5c [Accumulibacter sp.]|nr:type I-C CRISPR-associated protein Cas5c [Accumulibacter sp.]HMW17383.1 type I-C CRISPR-associated protein Cas5c [Accumulibacter sp.]HMX23404.1 type I-C CRISPR-associated protein Cas5c [Accumulibacter sp.]HMY06815.1 type I-C CRISPR-associated protein Cas5c [Accumulibacter sp.]HNC17001.1 type I-C CRISPR-associated protein Cas5c [Accumulibacter sp.]
MDTFCLEVSGDFACFTRPEMKVERVSYDVMTPAAARAVFEAVLWKPAIRWEIKRIEVLKPIRWISVRRNEVASKIPIRNVQTAMGAGTGKLALYVEDDRQQRAGLFLRDVAYRLHADLLPVVGDALDNPAKYREMFRRRAEQGQCVNQPYLGCREFAARFRLVDDQQTGKKTVDDAPAIDESRDLGWMLYDIDFAAVDDPKPRFFRAEMHRGVIDLSNAQVMG